MDDFCDARTGKIPALLWPNFAPPYTHRKAKVGPYSVGNNFRRKTVALKGPRLLGFCHVASYE